MCRAPVSIAHTVRVVSEHVSTSGSNNGKQPSDTLPAAEFKPQALSMRVGGAACASASVIVFGRGLAPALSGGSNQPPGGSGNGGGGDGGGGGGDSGAQRLYELAADEPKQESSDSSDPSSEEEPEGPAEVTLAFHARLPTLVQHAWD